MPYVNHRWLGGMLTNFVTIRSRVARMEELEAMVDRRPHGRPAQEGADRSCARSSPSCRTNLDGIRNDEEGLPDALYVVDTRREQLAIQRGQPPAHPRGAHLIDTNSDPDDVDYGIPANDDAIPLRQACMATIIADAVLAATGATEIAGRGDGWHRPGRPGRRGGRGRGSSR